jgi:uncharacterized protein (DUF952 family)
MGTLVPDYVYKILRPDEWASFQEDGTYGGSPDDKRDGFIHLSTSEQLAGTLAKHFHADARVMILKVRASGLPVRMETSRGGAQFPHLYGDLPLSAVEDYETRTPEG